MNSLYSRPSALIYLREDPEQTWRDCDSPYELGYAAAQADISSGMPALTDTEHASLWGDPSGYSEGYRDAWHDAESRQRASLLRPIEAFTERL